MSKTAITMITVVLGVVLFSLVFSACGKGKDEPRFATIKGGDGS